MTRVTHAVPADQPHSVHQIAERLFPAYTVEGGAMHLAGCLLDDRLFLRVAPPAGPASASLYLDSAGRPVEAALIEQLGLEQLATVARPPRRCDAELAAVVAVADRLLPQAADSPNPYTAIWAKYANGTLRFTIDERSVDLPFDGWARTLAPPPYPCPYTGVATFHLAATDDGRIAAAEQIASCAESGRRVLINELIPCSATGKRVLSDLIVLCPVTAQRLLSTATIACQACRQNVAPAALERGVCVACRSLAAIDKDDPRMARLLHEHPEWERWGSWKLAETATVYILSAARWLKRVLLVVDRQTLELRTLAVGYRFLSGWETVPAEQQSLVLSE
jgi:hypothetical protein